MPVVSTPRRASAPAIFDLSQAPRTPGTAAAADSQKRALLQPMEMASQAAQGAAGAMPLATPTTGPALVRTGGTAVAPAPVPPAVDPEVTQAMALLQGMRGVIGSVVLGRMHEETPSHMWFAASSGEAVRVAKDVVHAQVPGSLLDRLARGEVAADRDATGAVVLEVDGPGLEGVHRYLQYGIYPDALSPAHVAAVAERLGLSELKAEAKRRQKPAPTLGGELFTRQSDCTAQRIRDELAAQIKRLRRDRPGCASYNFFLHEETDYQGGWDGFSISEYDRGKSNRARLAKHFWELVNAALRELEGFETKSELSTFTEERGNPLHGTYRYWVEWRIRVEIAPKALIDRT